MNEIIDRNNINKKYIKDGILVTKEGAKWIQWKNIFENFAIASTTLSRAAGKGEIQKIKYLNNVYYSYDDLETYVRNKVGVEGKYRTIFALRNELGLNNNYIKSIISISNIKSTNIDGLEFYDKEEFIKALNSYKRDEEDKNNLKNKIREVFRVSNSLALNLVKIIYLPNTDLDRLIYQNLSTIVQRVKLIKAEELDNYMSHCKCSAEIDSVKERLNEIKFLNETFYKRDEIKNIIEELKNYNFNKNNFITQTELSTLFNSHRVKLLKILSEFEIEGFNYENKVLYSKAQLEPIVDRIALEFGLISKEILHKNLHMIENLNEILNSSDLDVKQFCGRSLYYLSQVNNVIKKLINKRFLYGETVYIKQPYIDRMYSDFEDFQLDDSSIYNINKVIEVLNKFKNNFIYYFENSDMYLSDTEISMSTGFSKDKIENFIDKETDILFIKGFEPKEIKLMRNMVKMLLLRNGYLSLMEMNGLINVTKNPTMRVKKDDIKSFILFDKTKYTTIELYVEKYKDYIRKASKGFKNIKYSMEVRLSLVKNQYIETNRLAKQFIAKVYNDDNSKDKSTYNRCINSIEWLLNNYWDKEIFEYTDKNIEEDILINCTNSYGIRVCQFFNYIKYSKSVKCNYNKIYGNSVIQQLKSDDEEQNEKIYSEKEWVQFYIFFKDIDAHKYKAIEDYWYSQAWLYCLSQLVISWRRKNILESMPNIPIELLNIDLEWFKNNNIDDMTAQVILNCVKFGVDGVVAYKNQMQLHFDTPISLKKSVATALIIANLHKNTNNEEYVFTNDFKKNMNKYIQRLLSETNLPMFYNSKAVRSGLTYSFSNALSSEEFKSVAYYLAQNSRSHKVDYEPTDITEEYLYLENTDGEVAKVSHELIERGIFGYLPYRLIVASMGGEVKKLEQSYITKLINAIFEELLPDEIEKASEVLIKDNDSINFINSSLMVKNLLANKNNKSYSKLSREILKSISKYVNDSNKIIEEMKTKGDTEIVKILMDILKNKRNCKDNVSNCILNDIERIEKCPYKNSDNGIGCKYNIRSLMSLYDINSRMLYTIDKLNGELSEIERIKYSKILKTYLIIINEAYIQYKFLDEYFLNAYFDKNDIVKKIKMLNKSNKIISNVEQNKLIKTLKESRGRI